MYRWHIAVLTFALLALGAACSSGAAPRQLRPVGTVTPAFDAGRDGAQLAAVGVVNEADTASTQPGSDQAAVVEKHAQVNEPSVVNTQPSPCPVGSVACTFAEQLADALAAGDIDAVIALAAAQPFTCQGAIPPPGLGGPYPLCDGSEVGERRFGYTLLFLGSEGVVLSEAQYRNYLQGFVDGALPEESDARGTGELRLAGVGCDKALAATVPPCAESPYIVAFSEIRRAPRLLYRALLLFRINRQVSTGDAIDQTEAGQDILSGFSLDSMQPPGATIVFFPFTHSGLRGK